MSDQPDILLSLQLPVRRWRLILDNMAINDVRWWGDIGVERHHRRGYTVLRGYDVVERFVLEPQETFLELQVRVARYIHQIV